ncbi:MAG: phenylacetate--CoA ligase family protein [Alphaproteobacteria bacterium]|nr:phenylacetate--CoA ligase family protein [Alphaproteobacteria bacterium]
MAVDRRFYDELEARVPEARERQLFADLPGLIAHAIAKAPGIAEGLKGVVPGDIVNRQALAQLPVIRKSELMDRQKARPPFGGLNATDTGQLQRIFASPGPIYDPEGKRADYWRFARVLFAAGFQAGEVIHNCFAYHLTPAGSMLESGAFALGCPVIPGGVGQTELQIRVMADVRPAGYVGTPSFLKIVFDKAKELGVDIGSVKKALVAAEALPNSLRAELQSHGCRVQQCYASADIGSLAYESEAREGMILDEALILEILRPGTGDPVPPGEVGEIVVTSFNRNYPLIRFATGDLSAVLPGVSPCGRTNTRIKGWMGRADQSAKVRAMFVHPSQIADIVRRHAGMGKARLTVDRVEGQDRMVLACEIAGAADPGLAAATVESIQIVCKLRGEVVLVAPGSLPNDGKVIEDIRKLD